jgi:hypothetical protein
MVTLADMDVLEKALLDIRPRLVVIDPLQAYLGASVDFHRANQTRPIFAALGKLGERHHCAVLLNGHLGKSTQSRAIYRALGSIDMVAAARSVLLVGLDPHDGAKRALIHVKSSLAESGNPLGYRIVDGSLVWDGLSTLTASELLAADATADEKTSLDEAITCILEFLAEGSRSVDKIWLHLDTQDISRVTGRRAKALLHKQGRIVRSGGGRAGPVYWRLPESSVSIDSIVSQLNVETEWN